MEILQFDEFVSLMFVFHRDDGPALFYETPVKRKLFNLKKSKTRFWTIHVEHEHWEHGNKEDSYGYKENGWK